MRIVGSCNSRNQKKKTMVDRVWVLVLIKDFKETKISIKDITSKELRLYDRETSYKEDL